MGCGDTAEDIINNRDAVCCMRDEGSGKRYTGYGIRYKVYGRDAPLWASVMKQVK